MRKYFDSAFNVLIVLGMCNKWQRISLNKNNKKISIELQLAK
jgi:hypothetical protein